MPVRLSPAVTSAMSLSLSIQRIFDDLVQELEANTRAHSWTGRIWSHAFPGASTSQEMAAYLSPLSRYRPIVPRSSGSAASINPHPRLMASGPTPVKSGFWMLNQFQKNRRPTNRKP